MMVVLSDPSACRCRNEMRSVSRSPITPRQWGKDKQVLGVWGSTGKFKKIYKDNTSQKT